MFTDGLPDALEPVLAVLAIVVVVAMFIHRSADRYAETRGYPKWFSALPDATPWACPHCGAHQDGTSRFCYSCKNYPTIADDPGSVQMMWLIGWLPALVVAVIVGTVAALITWEPWPLLIVLLAAPLLGWFATLVCFYSAGRLWWRHSRGEATAGLVVVVSWFGAGPAVAVVLAIVATLLWT